jgi:hypothetical protein
MAQRNVPNIHPAQEGSRFSPGQGDDMQWEREEGQDQLHIETASISTSVGTHD